MQLHERPFAHRSEERVAGVGPPPTGWPDAADVDRPAETALRMTGDLVEVVRVDGADDQHVDIVRYWSGLALVARGP